MPQGARIAVIAHLAAPILLLSAPAGARETRQLTAVRVGPGAIQVDGSLDDPGWAGVAFTAGVLPKRPGGGAAPSQPTQGGELHPRRGRLAVVAAHATLAGGRARGGRARTPIGGPGRPPAPP